MPCKVVSPYGMRRDWRRLTLWFMALAVIGGFVVAWPAIYFLGGLSYYLATTKPPNWDVVQAKGSDCQLSDHKPLPNGRGMVAVVREANCASDFAQGTSYNVVFVHRADEANTKANLVFQYTPGFQGDVYSPVTKLLWQSSTSLHITAPGVIEEIQTQKPEFNGVSLSYTLGRRLWP